MVELDKIYNADCLEFMKNLPDNCIDVIITSPPYNKAGFVGKIVKEQKSDLWKQHIDYDDDPENDFMDEEQYQKQQIAVLNEMGRIIKSDGSIFYNHKIRVNNNIASNPFSWIEKSNLVFRQMITWDRGATPQMGPTRFMHTTELIFWLSKDDSVLNFRRGKNIPFPGEVWRFPAIPNPYHPAPFPIDLPNNILDCIPGENKVVLDPYSGTGTTLLSAKGHGFHYIGIEKVKRYIDLANESLNQMLF